MARSGTRGTHRRETDHRLPYARTPAAAAVQLSGVAVSVLLAVADALVGTSFSGYIHLLMEGALCASVFGLSMALPVRMSEDIAGAKRVLSLAHARMLLLISFAVGALSVAALIRVDLVWIPCLAAALLLGAAIILLRPWRQRKIG